MNSVRVSFKWLENGIGDRGRQTVAHRGRRNADEALALALANGQTLCGVAQAVGIGQRTAARRVADPNFRNRVAELQAEVVQRALDKMADGLTEATAPIGPPPAFAFPTSSGDDLDRELDAALLREATAEGGVSDLSALGIWVCARRSIAPRRARLVDAELGRF